VSVGRQPHSDSPQILQRRWLSTCFPYLAKTVSVPWSPRLKLESYLSLRLVWSSLKLIFSWHWECADDYLKQPFRPVGYLATRHVLSLPPHPKQKESPPHYGW